MKYARNNMRMLPNISFDNVVSSIFFGTNHYCLLLILRTRNVCFFILVRFERHYLFFYRICPKHVSSAHRFCEKRKEEEKQSKHSKKIRNVLKIEIRNSIFFNAERKTKHKLTNLASPGWFYALAGCFKRVRK